MPFFPVALLYPFVDHLEYLLDKFVLGVCPSDESVHIGHNTAKLCLSRRFVFDVWEVAETWYYHPAYSQVFSLVVYSVCQVVCSLICIHRDVEVVDFYPFLNVEIQGFFKCLFPYLSTLPGIFRPLAHFCIGRFPR